MFELSANLWVSIAFGACVLCGLPLLFFTAVEWREGMASAEDDAWRDPVPWVLRLSRQVNISWTNKLDRRLSPAVKASLTRLLQQAGYSYSITPAELVAFRVSFFIVLMISTLPIIWAYQLDSLQTLLLICGFMIAGLLLPTRWLRDCAKRRKLSTEKDFPFFLDVLVLSMKAGLAFPAALQQATVQLPDGALKQELSRLVREVRTGSSRSDALQRLATRVRLSSISNFVAVVAQAEESGGSLTKALHEQSRQRRRERFQRAEKLANQAPVKMLLPLVAFLFPVTFIIIGFPLYEQLSGSGFFGD